MPSTEAGISSPHKTIKTTNQKVPSHFGESCHAVTSSYRKHQNALLLLKINQSISHESRMPLLTPFPKKPVRSHEYKLFRSSSFSRPRVVSPTSCFRYSHLSLTHTRLTLSNRDMSQSPYFRSVWNPLSLSVYENGLESVVEENGGGPASLGFLDGTGSSWT